MLHSWWTFKYITTRLNHNNFLIWKTHSYIYFWWYFPLIAYSIIIYQLYGHNHQIIGGIHLINFPQLMNYEWQKQITKLLDVMVNMHCYKCFWFGYNHEPPILGIFFNIFTNKHRFDPWNLKGANLVEMFQNPCRNVWRMVSQFV